MFRISLSVAPAAALLLAGCAGLQPDWGRAQAARYAAEHGRSIPQADGATLRDAVMAQPLTADAAIQLALVDNPAMRLQTAQLGFAAGDVYDAGRLANPVFSATRLSAGNDAAANAQLSLGIAVNFLNLLFLPANQRYAADQFEAAKLSMGAAALELAADVEQGWYQAVSAQQMVQMRQRIGEAARASARLAQRGFDAGNISPRQLAAEQSAASQAQLDLLSAQADAAIAHAALNRLMGLPATQDGWTLDARLPALPERDDALPALLALAAESRLDVAAARRRASALATRYGLVRRTRLIEGVQIGAEREKDFDGSINSGPSLSLSLPLFNSGAGRAAAAQAALDQAEAQLDALVLDSSNAVSRLHARLGADRERVRVYREALVPQREAAVARMSEEWSYMLIGAAELLAAKQQEYEAYAGYLLAVRDYWTTRTQLALAVGRQLPDAQGPLTISADAAADAKDTPPPAGHEHGHRHSAPAHHEHGEH